MRGDCPKCLFYMRSMSLLDHIRLVEACASVGISRNVSTEKMLAQWMCSLHKNDHIEPGRSE